LVAAPRRHGQRAPRHLTRLGHIWIAKGLATV
jgi:hypothetical protein